MTSASMVEVAILVWSLEDQKIGQRIGINVNGICRLDDHPFVLGANEIAADSFKCNLV